MRPALSDENALDLRSAIDTGLPGPPVNPVRQLETSFAAFRIDVI
jgi:hypothetical protein